MGLPGLPPLDGDDSILRRFGWRTRNNRSCQTQGCPNRAQDNTDFCGDCHYDHLWQVIQADEAHAPLEAPQAETTNANESASAFRDDQLNHRCVWCCRIMSERVAERAVRSTIPGRPSGMPYGFECGPHLMRRLAHEDALGAITWLLNEQHMTSRQVANIFAGGYLGGLQLDYPGRQTADPRDDDQPWDRPNDGQRLQEPGDWHDPAA